MLVIKVICHVCRKENIYPLDQFKDYETPNHTACVNCRTEFFEFDEMDSNEYVKFTKSFDKVEELI